MAGDDTRPWAWASVAAALLVASVQVMWLWGEDLYSLDLPCHPVPCDLHNAFEPQPSATVDRGSGKPVEELAIDEPIYRIGGNVRAPVRIDGRGVQFPDAIRRSKWILGVLILDGVVGSDGRVRGIRILKGDGDPGIDQLGVEALRRFRYRPATLNGKPVAVEIVVTFNHWPRRRAD